MLIQMFCLTWFTHFDAALNPFDVPYSVQNRCFDELVVVQTIEVGDQLI